MDQSVDSHHYSDRLLGSRARQRVLQVDVVFDQEASYSYDGTGAPPDVSEPATGTLLMLAMKYVDGHWAIREGQVEQEEQGE